jgi:hypothetical protein
VPRRVEALKRHRVVDVAAGGHHSLAVTRDPHCFRRTTLWVFGSNKQGQLGIATSGAAAGACVTAPKSGPFSPDQGTIVQVPESTSIYLFYAPIFRPPSSCHMPL